MDLLSFGELRKANVARCEGSFHPIKEWSPSDWGNALAGEVGKACNKIKKLRRGENIPVREVADELADVVAYTDLLAARMGIDLGRAVRRKFNEVSERVSSEIELFPSPLSDLQLAIASIAERDHHLKLMRLLLWRIEPALQRAGRYVDLDYEHHNLNPIESPMRLEIFKAIEDLKENDGLPDCVTCQHLGDLCGPHLRKAKGEKVEVDADPPAYDALCMEKKCAEYRDWLETQLFTLQAKARKE